LIFWHATIGYALIVLLPFATSILPGGNTGYRTFLYLFYTNNDSLMLGLPRNTGLMWEPGVLQLFLNLFLFLGIKRNAPPLLIALGILSVVTTQSTTGFFILAFNIAYYFLSQKVSFKNIIIAVSLAPVVLIGGIVGGENARHKISDQNTSAMVRARDTMIAFEMIKEKPILGHGLYDSEYLKSKPFVWAITELFFSPEFIKSSYDEAGGMTNGTLTLIALYGVPIFILILLLFINQKVFVLSLGSNLFFLLIYLTSLFTEPLNSTPFFLIFPISALALRNQSKIH
jgi:hypothetical protein